jgi:hypothetical protein
VLELNDIPELPLKVQRHAVLQVIRACHGSSPIYYGPAASTGITGPAVPWWSK